jgi:hypothetical protein
MSLEISFSENYGEKVFHNDDLLIESWIDGIDWFSWESLAFRKPPNINIQLHTSQKPRKFSKSGFKILKTILSWINLIFHAIK